jgi:hypothetical protein
LNAIKWFYALVAYIGSGVHLRRLELHMGLEIKFCWVLKKIFLLTSAGICPVVERSLKIVKSL